MKFSFGNIFSLFLDNFEALIPKMQLFLFYHRPLTVSRALYVCGFRSKPTW